MKSALTVILLIPFVAHANAASQPNVIVVFTDDHGYADLGCQGIRKDVKTPHIDSLAKGGVRMTSGYVTAPQCVPSRAGLLSGRYQNRFGVESNRESVGPFGDETTIAERLKSAGYATGMVGKWHLGPAGQITKHGFDDVYYQDGRWTNFNFAGESVKPGTTGAEMYHLEANNKAAVAFIQRHHRKLFFLYVAHRAPHVPLTAPKKYLDRFPDKMPRRRQLALAMISAMDDGVGAILATLRKHRIEEKTLIFVIGDNGAPLKIHKYDAPGGGPGWDGSLNDPFNGEKGMLSEGGIRVPFLAYWKGTLPAGKVYDHPVISLDVAATAVAVAGQEHDPKLDGVNLLPYLRGEQRGSPHEALYWRWIAQAAVREGKWKYLQGGTRRYLFDLDKDAGEKHNLIKKHPDIAAVLEARLKRWAGELKPAVLNGTMAATWNAYFDYYLDGKPAPPLRKKPAKSRRNRQAIFKRRDADRDGMLTLKELIGDPTKRDAQAITRQFKLLDKDGDGKLTLDEFLRPPAEPAKPVSGDAVIRGKAGRSEIRITTTSRLAGAIHSLTWNGKEFIDSFDHGRQLQSACSFNLGEAGFHAECYNPTEAGSRSDGRGDRSTSRLLKLSAKDGELKTTTRMAFWLQPGQKSAGKLAKNRTALSNHIVSKHVRIGYTGLPQVIDYKVTFTVPKGEHHTLAQFEALTGYMPPEFGQFLKFDPESGKLLPLDDGPGEQRFPVVLSTMDGRCAMGIYSPQQPSKGYEHAGYGRFRFPAAKVVKWNCVFRVRNTAAIKPGDCDYQMFVALGTREDVRQLLKSLHVLAKPTRKNGMSEEDVNWRRWFADNMPTRHSQIP